MEMKLKGIIRSTAVLFFLITVFAGNAFGGINEWTGIGPNTDNVAMFAVDPVNPAFLYVMTGQTISSSAFKTTNYGLTWSPIDTSDMTVLGFAIDPVDHNTLYVGTPDNVIKSLDGGNTWDSIYTAPAHYFFNNFAIDPVAHSVIYATTTYSGIMKSVDSGVSWNAVNNGLASNRPVLVTIDPSNHATIYAGTLGGLFKSTDGGSSWTGKNSSLVNAFVIDPQQTGTLYLATGSGIFKSTDGGDNWSNFSTGLPDPTFTSVTALAVDPSNSSNLYAGTSAGVYRSSNAGETWNAANTGLTNTSVTKLAIDPAAPANLYAGTNGGLFKITFQSTGTLYLNFTKLGAGNGTVSSNPPGIYCMDNCSALFNDGDLVTLHATASVGSLFMGWSGQCSGTGDCTILMDQDKGVSARFDLQTEHMVRVWKGSIPWPLYSIQDGYDFADSGNNIWAMGTDFIEDLNCGQNKSVILKGGYDSSFETCTGYTTMHGNLTIGDGELTLENLVIQ